MVFQTLHKADPHFNRASDVQFCWMTENAVWRKGP